MTVKPLLITGIHRSGTTWLGKTFASLPELYYVHEPFNFTKHTQTPINTWYYHIHQGSLPSTKHEIEDYLISFTKPSLSTVWQKAKKAKYPGQIKEALITEWNKLNKQPLFKDPIALFSAEWMYESLDVNVLISIRHPAAFIASLKVKGWEFDFKNLINQQDLMKGFLRPYQEEIWSAAHVDLDIIDQGILLWKVIYRTVLELQEKYQDHAQWYFLRHEDISREPVKFYKEICQKFNYSFNDHVLREIERTTQSPDQQYLARDAVKNIESWKKRLTSKEVDRIKEGTQTEWPNFYTENDW